MTVTSDIEREIERNYRHNAVVNVLDGAFFWLGGGFLAPRIILPLYVSHFTTSKLVIGLLSTIAATGWLLPQLFTARWVQRLPRKKVAPVNLGFFTERLPVLLMVPAAWLATRSPTLALVTFFVLFAWHVVGAGVVAVGWQDMLAKIIPLDRRGRFFGITNFGGTATGVLGATAAAWLLDRYDFPRGYMLCFAAASVFIFISWVFLALTREPAQASQEPALSQREYWRRLPAILRTDQNFRRYLFSQIVITIGGMAVGFLAVYAVQRWQLPDSQAGSFTASMLVGQALSNPLFGALADRKGHKLVLELSTLLAALSVGLASLASGPAWFYVVFALSGASAAGFMLSGVMIIPEFSAPGVRPTYIGLSNTVIGVVAAAAPLVGGWLAGTIGDQWFFAIAFVIGLAGFALLRWSVREPRGVKRERKRKHQRLSALIGVPITLLIGCMASCAPTEQPGPQILTVEPHSLEVARYEKLELAITLEAAYENPYDARQVDLTAVFTAPDGQDWTIPGFWDGQDGWRVRFTPSAEGERSYRLVVRDGDGESEPFEGQFTCAPSDHHGWLQVGDWVDPAYSPRYLVHHDTTPFYGVGHCDAFDVMSYGFDAETGFTLFDKMTEHGENTLVYWPIYSNPFFVTRYDRYSTPDLKIIDMVVEDAARKGIYLVFTVWNHDLLRDEAHPWPRQEWNTLNGFRELGGLDDFFTADEMWAWQENLYRYFIARWGYSPAIGMWLTVSEIEGTNAGRHADAWHERVNAYFAQHDAYRHPTTASMAGDAWWPAGYAVMDVAQMHSYDSQHDPVGIGPLLAGWTQKMWQAEQKPNFIGEFGAPDERLHPELLHNGVWAGLAAGAAVTPMEWNDSNAWGRMSDEMYAQMAHLATFVADLPLAHLNPAPLDVTTSDQELRAWGLVSEDQETGFFWLQASRRVGESAHQATVVVKGLAPGGYTVRPYDTWQGVYLEESLVTADKSGRLTITVPSFNRDIAVRLERPTTE